MKRTVRLSCGNRESDNKNEQTGDITVATTHKHNHMLPNMYTKSQRYTKSILRMVGLPPAFGLRSEQCRFPTQCPIQIQCSMSGVYILCPNQSAQARSKTFTIPDSVQHHLATTLSAPPIIFHQVILEAEPLVEARQFRWSSESKQSCAGENSTPSPP